MIRLTHTDALAMKFHFRTQSTPANRFQIPSTRATAYLYERICEETYD